jgi:hypothetical protein
VKTSNRRVFRNSYNANCSEAKKMVQESFVEKRRKLETQSNKRGCVSDNTSGAMLYSFNVTCLINDGVRSKK